MILSSTMIGEDAPNPNNQKLNVYNDFLRDAANERGLLFADLNADIVPVEKMTPAGLKSFLESETAKWAPVIKKAGIYAD